MNISCEALEGIMEEKEELRIAMMKILSDRLFESYGRLNVITKIEQRRDYFTIFKEELRLDVRNLRRFQQSGRFWEHETSEQEGQSEEELESWEGDRSLAKTKRVQL